MKVERVSYDVMTPSAARGILEAIHWKPAIRWVIDEIHVLKPIRFQSIRRNEVGHKAPAGKIKSAMKAGSLDGAATARGRRPPAARRHRAGRCRLCHRRAFRADAAEQAPTTTKASISTSSTVAPRAGSASTSPAWARASSPRAFELLPPDAPMPPPIDDTRDLGFMLWDIDHARDRASMFFRARLEERRDEGARPQLPGDPPMSSPLASLVRAYDRMADRGEVPPFGYSTEKIGFVISLNEDGTLAGVPTDLRSGEGKKRIARPMAVPQPAKRTSGIASNFLWDKTAYVLGVTAGEGKRSARRTRRLRRSAIWRCSPTQRMPGFWRCSRF